MATARRIVGSFHEYAVTPEQTVQMKFEAGYGVSREFAEFAASRTVGIDRGTVIGRVLLERKITHIPDVLADPEYAHEGQKLSAAFARSLASRSCEKDGRLA